MTNEPTKHAAQVEGLIAVFNAEFCPGDDYHARLVAAQVTPGDCASIKDYAREAGGAVVFERGYTVAVARLDFLAGWLAHSGAVDREAARIGRASVVNGAADWTIAGNVLEDHAARPCDVMTFEDVLFAGDGRQMEAARKGVALARELDLGGLEWTMEAAREFGARVNPDWPKWAQKWFGCRIVEGDPVTDSHAAYNCRNRQSQALYGDMDPYWAAVESSEAYQRASREAQGMIEDSFRADWFSLRDRMEAIADSVNYH